MAVASLAHRAQVFQGDGLSAAAVVGDRHHHEWDVVPADLGDGRFQSLDVHIALERVIGARITPFGDDQIASFRTLEFDVGSGRVEVSVVRHHRPRPGDDGEEDSLRCPTLVRRDHLRHSGQVLHDGAQPLVGTTPGVRLVTDHDRRPLRGRHRPGAGVCE